MARISLLIGSRNALHLCLVLENDWTSPQLATIAAGHQLKVSPGASYAIDKVDQDFVRVSLMSEMDEARVKAGLRLLKGLVSSPPATFLSGA
jgi:DNA-binding transcriptional MocR family regulator